MSESIVEVQTRHFDRTAFEHLIEGIALSYTSRHGWELFHKGIALGFENGGPENWLKVWIDDVLVHDGTKNFDTPATDQPDSDPWYGVSNRSEAAE